MWGRNLKHEIEIARDLALEGGRILRRYHSEEIQVGYRRDTGEPLTIAELQVDDIITSGLSCAFPDDIVCSRQSVPPPTRRGAPRVWLVDAVDGTRDFIRHGSEACISIGLLVQDRPALGVVFNPMRDELFAAVTGTGTTLNDWRTRSSAPDNSSVRRISFATDEAESFDTMEGLGFECSAIASVAYRLARVAAGWEDGTFTLAPVPEYSSCAGVALILAAGGRVTTPRGLPLVYNSAHLRHGAGLLAAGAPFHPALANLASLLGSASTLPI